MLSTEALMVRVFRLEQRVYKFLLLLHWSFHKHHLAGKLRMVEGTKGRALLGRRRRKGDHDGELFGVQLELHERLRFHSLTAFGLMII